MCPMNVGVIRVDMPSSAIADMLGAAGSAFEARGSPLGECGIGEFCNYLR